TVAISLYPSTPTAYLHSFPTRRSSDLLRRGSLRGLPTAWLPPRCVVEIHDDLPDLRLREAILPGRHRRVPRRRLPREPGPALDRSEEHTSELQSRVDLVCRLLLEKKKG